MVSTRSFLPDLLYIHCISRSGTADADYLGIFITEVEGELQVSEEVVSELWIHVEHLQDLLPLNGVEVAVAQRTHVSAGLARLGVLVDHLAKNVILT